MEFSIRLQFKIYLKDSKLQGFFKDFNKGLRRTTFSIAFCSIPTFAERHKTIASKAKYETEIQNSGKCLSVYEKMKKMLFLS